MSAAWDGEGRGTPGREEEESWNSLFEGRSGPGETRGSSHRLDVGETRGRGGGSSGGSSHRSSRVSTSGQGHGFIAEVNTFSG